MMPGKIILHRERQHVRGAGAVCIGTGDDASSGAATGRSSVNPLSAKTGYSVVHLLRFVGGFSNAKLGYYGRGLCAIFPGRAGGVEICGVCSC